MKKIIGYCLDGAGMNDKGVLENMISEEWHQFSNVYDINYMDDKFKITGRFKTYDFICSYDGYSIVSQKFKDFCFDNNYENLEFVPFPNDSLFYWFKVHKIVIFDSEKKGTRFINYSEKHHSYEEVIGANPVILKDNILLKDGFYRTDICFGTGLNQREKQHKNSKETKDLEFETKHETDVYEEQRGLEGKVYNENTKTANKENGGLNRSKAIRDNNPRKDDYEKAANDYLKKGGGGNE